MNKYYKPSIEEFHPGFEYEEKISNLRGQSTEHWIQSVWTEKHNFDELFDVEYYHGELIKVSIPDSIRVKRLNNDDIESQGFKLFGYSNEQHPVYVWRTGAEEYDYTIRRQHGIIKIAKGREALFNGTIRNISEFKRILKQIGYDKL